MWRRRGRRLGRGSTPRKGALLDAVEDVVGVAKQHLEKMMREQVAATQIPNPSCDFGAFASVWGGVVGANEVAAREGEAEPWRNAGRMERERWRCRVTRGRRRASEP